VCLWDVFTGCFWVEFGMFLDRAWDVLVILKEKLVW
jgi:hypothetical protein